jgi:hypothetical protein
VFIDRIPGQVADYESILRDFNADVVLVDMCSLGAATLYDRNGPIFATLGINPLVTEDPQIPPWGSHRPPAARLCPDWQVGYVEVDELLRQAVRASSAGEGVNSVVRMHPGRHRHVSQEMLDLKRLYWNCRVFREGKRKEWSPYERLGLKLPTSDWWQLLQMDSHELEQKLLTQ